MSDIPEDIRAAASHVVTMLDALAERYHEHAKDAEVQIMLARYDELKSAGKDFTASGFLARAEFIQRALLAERNATIERCAKVAEGVTPFIPGLPSHDENNVRVLEGEKIAAAIRSQAASQQKMDALDKAIICDLIPKTYRVEE